MATPTRRHGASVSTPSHPTQSSPAAPRSVPSPITARQPAGKTPVGHPTTGSTGSKTIGNTPMLQSLSQTGYSSSPNAANMLSFSTPSGLGIEGATPAGLNLHTPGLGGTNMVPTMSDLGPTVSGRKRNEDEERRAKMRKVLRKIGKPTGRVSEEGIARISRRVGFFNDIDAEKLTPEEKERKVGNRPISTAGNTVVIDLDLKDNVPRACKVAFNGKATGMKEQEERAGAVLLNDLTAPDGIPLDAKLDRFAVNLEHLARMDRLSSNGINCFEAISGLYTSLRRLYEQETVAARALFNGDTVNIAERADREVMCKRSGRPVVHENDRLGLEIVYWRDGGRVHAADTQRDTEMEVDGKQNSKRPSDGTMNVENAFTLRIEAEACPAGLYPPLRVSDTWLPEPLQLISTESGEQIPWQDPTSTFLTANASTGAMAVEGDQKLPDLRFIAKLDPPLAMPYQTAMNVLSEVAVPAPQPLAVPPSYAALLLDSSEGTQLQAPASTFTRTSEQIVLSQRDGEETTTRHRYTLNSAKPAYSDYGFEIRELPFSHPRQLIQLLPTLRQWARVGSLLKATFDRGEKPSQANGMAMDGAVHVNRSKMAHLTLSDLLAAPEESVPDSCAAVNITLATTPMPTMGLTFPTRGTDVMGNVNVQVLPNADILVTEHEGVALDSTTDAAAQGQRLARALDACGDLGVWIEWVRTRRIPLA